MGFRRTADAARRGSRHRRLPLGLFVLQHSVMACAGSSATPRDVRNAIVYVLQNHLHHNRSAFVVDECSSARWFTGWAQPVPVPLTPSPVAAPRTWLARIGWRRHGPVRFDEGPCDHSD